MLYKDIFYIQAEQSRLMYKFPYEPYYRPFGYPTYTSKCTHSDTSLLLYGTISIETPVIKLDSMTEHLLEYSGFTIDTSLVIPHRLYIDLSYTGIHDNRYKLIHSMYQELMREKKLKSILDR